MIRRIAITVLVAACSGGGSDSPADAAIDAPAVPVQALSSCPATVSASIMDSATMFLPKASTIPVGGVVKFEITAEHTVIPNSALMTDPALMVARGETKCFRFNQIGTWGFACGIHGFAGTITVQ